MFETLSPYGWGDRWLALFLATVDDNHRPGAAPARVVRHDGASVLAATADGIQRLPVLASVTPSPVVGDWVVIDGDAVVDVLPRAGLLRRQDPEGGEQPLVANLDAVMIVCGLDRPVKPGRIMRTVALAWDAGARPVVVLSKVDVVADPAEAIARVEAAAPGIDVVITSATTGAGLDELRVRAAVGTVALIGESGAGKSTLTNALVGQDVAAAQPVRVGDAKGRHTTTRRELYPLPSGGVLVDTPGMRAVGLLVDADAVASTFDDVEELAERCRFNDCAHGSEPGCAVTAAVESGDLQAERLASWRRLQKEAAAAVRRADEHERRQYERQFGRLVKDAQRRKGRS